MFAIRHGATLVNQVLGSPEGGGIGNVYLRRRTRAGVTHVPHAGAGAPGAASRPAPAAPCGSARSTGSTTRARSASRPTDPTWFWTIHVRNATRRRVSVDAVLAQDLGLAHESAVRSSEAYTSQYLDHTVLASEEELGFLVCSRQNLPQGGATPWVMHGCLDGAAGYLTDGMQLYGLDYRATGIPAALERRRLPNRVYQYELALPTVLSRAVTLQPGASCELTFFAAFVADHPGATGEADADVARAARDEFARLPPSSFEPAPQPVPSGVFDDPHPVPQPGPRTRPASSGGSGRTGATRNVATGDSCRSSTAATGTWSCGPRSCVSERPTGLIMLSGRALFPSDDTLSVTAWMCGGFASQLAIGNTSFNKVLGVARDPLNVLRSSGQRIFIRTDRGLELLGVPSAFEMTPTSARWIYEDERFTVVVSVATSPDAPVCTMTIDIERGGPTALLVTHEIVLGANEFDAPGRVSIDASSARVELRPDPASLLGVAVPGRDVLPRLPGRRRRSTRSAAPSCCTRTGRSDGGSHVVVRTKPVTHLTLALTGSLLDAARRCARGLAADGGRRERRSPASRRARSARRCATRPGPEPCRTRSLRRGSGVARPWAGDRATRSGHRPPRRRDPVVPPRRADPLHEPARAGAVQRGRVGPARRVPGPGGAARRRPVTRGRSATRSGSSTPTSTAGAATGRSGSWSTGSGRSRGPRATRTSSTGRSRRCATTSS